MFQQLFTDPKIQYPIYNMDLHFDDYTTKCKTLIEKTRIDLTKPDAHTIIEANSPWELSPTQPAKAGVLFIHGLLDSPFQFRDLGNLLKNQGFLVRSLLLPGHGTVPGALLNIDYKEWQQAVRYGIASFRNDVERIILIGNSTGASLALHHVAENNANIAGVVLLSPPLKINSIFAPFAGFLRQFKAWFHIDPEETADYAKYGSLPFNAIYQVHRLSKEKTQTDTPLFFILSQDDAIVCPKTIINHLLHHANPNNRLLLYTNKENHFNDPRIETRPSAYSEQKIINISHIALPFSPNNPHYGKEGDYKYTSRIGTIKNAIYGEFLRDRLFYNRCMLKWYLTNIRKERLTFNPDFEFMAERISEFVNTCAWIPRINRGTTNFSESSRQ